MTQHPISPKENILPKNSIQNTNPKNTQKTENTLQEGDIIFQISLSGQGKAIQLATKSNYTHCGLVCKYKGEWYVYEAIQPVTLTPLKMWINRGEKRHFVVKRLKNAENILTNKVIENIKNTGKKYLNKNYDIWFAWSDENIYCSELVWKTYKQTTHLEIGTCKKLKDFDLSHPEVKRIMAQRYGNNIPLEETVISPEDIFKSDLLAEIKIVL